MIRTFLFSLDDLLTGWQTVWVSVERTYLVTALHKYGYNTAGEENG